MPTPDASSTAPTSSPEAAEGQLVAIGDRSLWLECAGQGSPTVLLESGLGGDHRTWERVMPELIASATVCTYDRANVGDSDPGPEPRTAATAVEDLQAVLAAADLGPPYVLVGFSYGGIISQLYAATHPDETAALVLVESNHPYEAEQFEKHLTPEQIAEDRGFALDNPEHLDVFAGFEELQAAGTLPNVPLVVITAGISEGWPPGWDAATFDALRAEQQADLATFTEHGRQVIAESSRHQVPTEEPEVIVDAVNQLLEEISG